jgi:hypothetical protein
VVRCENVFKQESHHSDHCRALWHGWRRYVGSDNLLFLGSDVLPEQVDVFIGRILGERLVTAHQYSSGEQGCEDQTLHVHFALSSEGRSIRPAFLLGYPNFHINFIHESEVEFQKGSNHDIVTVDLRKIAEIDDQPGGADCLYSRARPCCLAR